MHCIAPVVMPAQPALDEPQREVHSPHRLTRAAYRSLIDLGHIDADAKVELLNGVIEDMSPRGAEHRATAHYLLKRLIIALGDRAAVVSQCSFAASDFDEPEPDIAIVPAESIEDKDLTRAFCLIEVSVSSRRRDLVKAAVYARAGVMQYILVDVPKRQALVHRGPHGDAYDHVDIVREGTPIVIDAFPDVTFDLAAVLPRGT